MINNKYPSSSSAKGNIEEGTSFYRPLNNLNSSALNQFLE
jgi:hypothetical protein